MSKFISIIIPIPELEVLTQDIRYSYDIFALRGNPCHITLIYEINMETYKRNKLYLLKNLKNLLKRLKLVDIECDHIIDNGHMLAIGLDDSTVRLINTIQKIIVKYLKIDKTIYERIDRLPHITLFTGCKNIGWKQSKSIKNSLKLPINIKINKIWITEVDTVKNIAKPLEIIN
jgi:hypothetical protein